VVQDGNSNYLYVTNYGSDNVSAYTINATSGALTPVAGSPFAAGSGPQGVPLKGVPIDTRLGNTDTLYVANEGSNNVSAYTISATSGALTPVAGSPFGAGTGPFGVATCSVTRKGHSDNYFAYVTNRGSNNVSAYTINATSGALTPVAGSPFGAGTEPLGMGTVGAVRHKSHSNSERC
jgi:6-phosphogluconolactonase (cycloisomerase 2 family)